MKTMRKVFAMVLVLAMVLTLAVAASAATAMTDTGTITIKKATAGTTYTLYRVLDIEKVAADGENVYILNNKWRDFITTEAAKADAKFTLSGDYVKTVLDTAGAQEFAEAVVAYAKANGIEHDGQSKMTISGDYTSGTPRQYGYYVLASDREGLGVKYTVFAIDKSVVSIDEKNVSVASIEKFVQEDSDINEPGNGWGEENAAEIAQPISFKIIAEVAPGTDVYTIEDKALNFQHIENLNVEYSGGALTQGSDYTVSVNDEADAGDNGFVITLSDNFRKLIEEGDKITITYTACLKATATIAGTGNINEVELKEAGTVVDSDTTTTYTYKLNVNKVDENGNPLAGATFQFSHNGVNLKFAAGENNTYVVSHDGAVESITTDATGKFTISGLDTEDEYVLTETAAPSGYILMDPETIVLAHSDSATQEITVTNLPGVELPSTGGVGTTIFYVIGAVLVCGAAVLLVTKKRMGAAE